LDRFINTGLLSNECGYRYSIFYMLSKPQKAIFDSQYSLRTNRAITLWFNERKHNIYLFIALFEKSRSTPWSSWFKASRTIIKLQRLPKGSYSSTFLESLGFNLLFYNGSSWHWFTLWNDISFIYLCKRWVQPFTESCRNIWHPYLPIIRKIHCSGFDDDWMPFIDKSCRYILPIVLRLLHK
jgi:hypothetical protein